MKVSKTPLAITILTLLLLAIPEVRAQDTRVMRIARLTIDSAQLKEYEVFMREQIEAAVTKEPGVLMLYAVREKNRPTHITVFEIYASPQAYQSHIQSAHFQKYKSGTLKMVKSLELVDVDPIEMRKKD